MAFFRKRSRSVQPFSRRTRFKSSGRRLVRRGRRFGTRSMKGYSAQFGKSYSTTFRTRKIGLRRFRNHLWNSTLFKAHYRSVAGASTTIGTPNNTVEATLIRTRALHNDIEQFYRVNGGITAIDTGILPPGFNSDIILRGGIARISFSNHATDDAVKVKVWAVWANASPDLTIVPTPLTVPAEWDPSIFADFRQFGKVLMQKESVLLPGSRPFEVTWRFKPQKIDDNTWSSEQGSQLYWLYSLSQMQNTEPITPTPEVITVVKTFNVSLSGDAF